VRPDVTYLGRSIVKIAGQNNVSRHELLHLCFKCFERLQSLQHNNAGLEQNQAAQYINKIHAKLQIHRTCLH